MTRALIALVAVVSIAALLPSEPPQPSISDGSRVSRSRAPDQAARADDRRPLYVAAGLVVLVAALWWSRRQRDRFDVEDSGADSLARPGDHGAAGKLADDGDADDDADDLHAAARASGPAPAGTTTASDAPDGRTSDEESSASAAAPASRPQAADNRQTGATDGQVARVPGRAGPS